MTILETDAGLWEVWDTHGKSIGFVYDRGAKVAGQRNTGYDALDAWVGGISPGNTIGKATTVWGAAKLLRLHHSPK